MGRKPRGWRNVVSVQRAGRICPTVQITTNFLEITPCSLLQFCALVLCRFKLFSSDFENKDLLRIVLTQLASLFPSAYPARCLALGLVGPVSVYCDWVR